MSAGEIILGLGILVVVLCGLHVYLVKSRRWGENYGED